THGVRYVWLRVISMSSIFFFQAEDGIRDFHVTGVQTCALPILLVTAVPSVQKGVEAAIERMRDYRPEIQPPITFEAWLVTGTAEIGRASCRERVEIAVVAASFKKKTRNRMSIVRSVRQVMSMSW